MREECWQKQKGILQDCGETSFAVWNRRHSVNNKKTGGRVRPPGDGGLGILHEPPPAPKIFYSKMNRQM